MHENSFSSKFEGIILSLNARRLADTSSENILSYAKSFLISTYMYVFDLGELKTDAIVFGIGLCLFLFKATETRKYLGRILNKKLDSWL